MDFYILDARGRPAIEASDRRWSQWQETDMRRFLAETRWEAEAGEVEVTTTFLGFDPVGHNPPALWDTVAWLHPRDGSEPERIDQWHHTSRAGALRGHDAMVKHLGGERDNDRRWAPPTFGAVAAFVPVGIRILDLMDGKLDGVIHIARRCLRF